jgi:hypothetical protein
MFVEHCIQWLYATIGGTGTDAFHTLVVFFGVLAVVRLVQWYRQLLSLPPGPWGLPLFGYLPFMKGVDLHLRFGELAKKYGSMFSARLGTQLVVVLSDYRIIRETFRREEFTGRPHTEFINILGGYGKFSRNKHVRLLYLGLEKVFRNSLIIAGYRTSSYFEFVRSFV